jgi:hypothetical protein
MIQRAHLPAEQRLTVRDHQRAQRVVGVVLWVVFIATLLGIGALRGS